MATSSFFGATETAVDGFLRFNNGPEANGGGDISVDRLFVVAPNYNNENFTVSTPQVSVTGFEFLESETTILFEGENGSRNGR